MKKIIYVFVLVFLLLFISCGEKNITSIDVPKEVVLFVGEEKEIEVKYEPVDSTEKLAISVTDNNIVSFDGNKIKGLSKGETTIIFESKNLQEFLTVKVLSLDDIELSIELEKEEYFLGDSAKVVIKSSYDFGEYNITVSKGTIDKNTISFTETGVCEITVSPVLYPNKQTKKSINVKEKVSAEDIICNLKEVMVVGDVQEIIATIIPEEAVDELIITSSNENVIAVENNYLKALTSGTSEIKLIAGKINKVVNVLVLSENEVDITTNIMNEYNVDESVFVTISSNIIDGEFVISSSDSNIANVNDNVITFINKGTVQITISLKNHENVKTTINVNVKKSSISGKEVQKLLQSTLETYIKAANATVKIELENKNQVFVETFAFEKAQNLYRSLYHEVNSNVASLLIIKDDMLYINLNDVKTKFPCSEEEQNELSQKENIGYVLKDVTDFYNDDVFFNCLVLKEVQDNKKVYELDIRNYLHSTNSPSINVLNVDEVLLEITNDENIVNQCNLVLKSLDNQKSVKVNYLGLEFLVDFPNDLDDYLE